MSKHVDGIAFLNIILGDECKKRGMKKEAVSTYSLCKGYLSYLDSNKHNKIVESLTELDPTYTPSPQKSSSNGCYVATCVYGSYDCPEVWTLRRFRDYTLDNTWYGRLFIKCYYAISPTIVKWFGTSNWFRVFWKSRLDKMVSHLQDKGIENTEYEDKY